MRLWRYYRREKNIEGCEIKRGAEPKAEALRQAALKPIKNPAARHPFYRAGFVLVGGATRSVAMNGEI